MTWCDAPINVDAISFCGELAFALFVSYCGPSPQALRSCADGSFKLVQLRVPSHPSSSLFTIVSFLPLFPYALVRFSRGRPASKVRQSLESPLTSLRVASSLHPPWRWTITTAIRSRV